MSKRQSHSTYTGQSDEEFQTTLNTLKDFLIPQIREFQAKRLVNYYTTHYENKIINREKKLNFYRSNSIINEKINNNISILDYSFVTGKTKKNIKPKKNFGKTRKQVEKLEKKILKKVLSQQTLFSNKSKKTTIFSTDENIYERGKEKKIEYEQKMNQLREEKEKNEFKNIRNKPKISEGSKRIMENKSQLPLYLRIDQIQEDKINNLSQIKKKFQKEKIIKRNTYRDKFEDKNLRFNKWFEMSETWDKIKEARLNFIKKEIEDIRAIDELNERKEETFHPKISKKSEQIFKEKYSENFQERMKQYENNKIYCENKLKKQAMPSFKPNINKNFKIRDEFYERYKLKPIEFYDEMIME